MAHENAPQPEYRNTLPVGDSDTIFNKAEQLQHFFADSTYQNLLTYSASVNPYLRELNNTVVNSELHMQPVTLIGSADGIQSPTLGYRSDCHAIMLQGKNSDEADSTTVVDGPFAGFGAEPVAIELPSGETVYTPQLYYRIYARPSSEFPAATIQEYYAGRVNDSVLLFNNSPDESTTYSFELPDATEHDKIFSDKLLQLFQCFDIEDNTLPTAIQLRRAGELAYDVLNDQHSSGDAEFKTAVVDTLNSLLPQHMPYSILADYLAVTGNLSGEVDFDFVPDNSPRIAVSGVTVAGISQLPNTYRSTDNNEWVVDREHTALYLAILDIDRTIHIPLVNIRHIQDGQTPIRLKPGNQ